MFGFGGASVFLFALATLAIGLLAARSRDRRAAESDEVDTERASGATLPTIRAQPRVQPRARVASAAEVLAAKLREHELARERERHRKATEARRGANMLRSLSDATLRGVL